MRILICGDRNWRDCELIHQAMMARVHDFDVLIEGECRGADIISRMIATEYMRQVAIKKFPAMWDLHGKSAGHIRNQAMLDAMPNEVWAFHDDLKNSKGTVDMIKRAMKNGVRVLHFSHECPTGHEMT